MYRAIERNLQYTANFTQKHKKFAMHCKFLEKVSYICSAFHFFAIKIECKMNSKVNK